MNRSERKAFTITELVIVLAIIAILAAVLIPAIASIINKANQSADIQAVSQMNIALAAGSAVEKPETVVDVIKILDDAGYNSADKLVPVSKDHGFYWYNAANIILLIKDTDGQPPNLIHPTNNETANSGFENVTDNGLTLKDNGFFDLEEGKETVDANGDLNDLEMDIVLGSNPIELDGKNNTIENDITIPNSSPDPENIKEVVINTNGFPLTVSGTVTVPAYTTLVIDIAAGQDLTFNDGGIVLGEGAGLVVRGGGNIVDNTSTGFFSYAEGAEGSATVKLNVASIRGSGAEALLSKIISNMGVTVESSFTSNGNTVTISKTSKSGENGVTAIDFDGATIGDTKLKINGTGTVSLVNLSGDEMLNVSGVTLAGSTEFFEDLVALEGDGIDVKNCSIELGGQTVSVSKNSNTTTLTLGSANSIDIEDYAINGDLVIAGTGTVEYNEDHNIAENATVTVNQGVTVESSSETAIYSISDDHKITANGCTISCTDPIKSYSFELTETNGAKTATLIGNGYLPAGSPENDITFDLGNNSMELRTYTVLGGSSQITLQNGSVVAGHVADTILSDEAEILFKNVDITGVNDTFLSSIINDDEIKFNSDGELSTVNANIQVTKSDSGTKFTLSGDHSFSNNKKAIEVESGNALTVDIRNHTLKLTNSPFTNAGSMVITGTGIVDLSGGTSVAFDFNSGGTLQIKGENADSKITLKDTTQFQLLSAMMNGNGLTVQNCTLNTTNGNLDVEKTLTKTTLSMTSDFQFSGLTVYKDYTVNVKMKGYTLDTSQTSGITVNGTLDIDGTGGTLNIRRYNGNALVVNEGGTLTLDNVEIYSNNADFNDNTPIYGIYNNGGTITIDGGSFKIDDKAVKSNDGKICNNSGTLTFTNWDSVFDNRYIVKNGGTVKCNDTTYETIPAPTITGDVYTEFNPPWEYILTLVGGEYDYDDCRFYDIYGNSIVCSINAQGITITGDVACKKTLHFPDLLAAIINNDNITISDEHDLIFTGSIGEWDEDWNEIHEDFNMLISKDSNGTKITLREDLLLVGDSSIVVSEGKQLTIDLNGYALSLNKGSTKFELHGDLSITGTGELVYSWQEKDYHFDTTNGGAVTIGPNVTEQ